MQSLLENHSSNIIPKSNTIALSFRMDQKLPSKRSCQDSADKGRKKVCTKGTQSKTNYSIEKDDIQSNTPDKDIATLTKDMKKLLFGKLEKDKVYTINVEHQVVVQPRTLPTGVTPTGDLTMNELKECAKKHLQVTDAENNMTMTESDFIGLCSFEDKYDLMVDKKESVLNLNEKNENISGEDTMHDRSFTSTNNISSKYFH